jgi:DNA-binding NarL/FixJ family response regulator
MSDLCLDEFTDHGHCGVLADDGSVDNDATLDRYASMALAQAATGAPVLGLSGMMDGQVGYVRSALDAGASGYLLKDADADEVAASLRAAYRGELQLDAAVTRALVGAPQGGRGNPAAALTSRELEVLGLVGAGNANKAIARELAITERTTRSHVSSILAKLGLSSRTQLALWAVRNGLASGGDAEDSQAVSA